MSTPTPISVSVIIPAYNAASSLGACLQALQQQSDPSLLHEVIVVDNGSTDETATIARQYGATLLHEGKRGAAAARNKGIRHATGELIAFTDADCVPTAVWLNEITAPLRHNPHLAGCKGTYLTQQTAITARLVQQEYEDKYDRLPTDKPIDFIDTYSCAYRREVLLANDGFDEGVFYVEDQELSFRLAARGYDLRFQPTAQVYHQHAASVGAYFRKKRAIGYWKAQIVRRFPRHAVRDSHTPQVLKVQMGLIMLSLLAIPTALLGFIWSPLALLPLLPLLLFLLTTLPFVGKTWGKKERAVALSAPLLLAVRALALSLGYIEGMTRPAPLASPSDKPLGISGRAYWLKRGLDVVGGVIGVMVTAVLFLPIALAIKLDSPGPILFRQTRAGQGGRPFTIYKFRTMQADAEAQLAQLLDIENLHEPVYKLQNDPRITRVGQFLRRWSLDELPQFWNVLTGEMSLIGPRPEEAWLVAFYTDAHRQRLAVKPGLSGPMQVSGRGDLSLEERLGLELAYIREYTFWQDVRLLWRTIPAVLHGRGAR
jgi:lipopolysaccharide/colanic/teichoic acid biosynthesis glycosyltransferase/GT2 family glycosyltransferase